jgi:acyl-CoA thioesterase I
VRICFFGDSFVNGTGDDTCLGWVGRICSNYRNQGVDLTSYNLGVRRDTSKDIAKRWEAEANVRLPIGIPARLVFSFGNNDTAKMEDGHTARLTLEECVNNARAIFSKAYTQAPTFMIGPVPIFPDTAQNARVIEYSIALAQLCDELQIPFLSLTSLSVQFWDDWAQEAKLGDGVHPNFRGYQNLAGVINEWEPLQSSLMASA